MPSTRRPAAMPEGRLSDAFRDAVRRRSGRRHHPPQHDHGADVHRADAQRGEHQPRRLLPPPRATWKGRSSRSSSSRIAAGEAAVGWPSSSSCTGSQHDQRRRGEGAEWVTRLLLVVLLPALGALINGLRAFAQSARAEEQTVTNAIALGATCLSALVAAFAVIAYVSGGRDALAVLVLHMDPGRHRPRRRQRHRQLLHRLRLPRRPALLHDADDRHVDRLPDPRLLRPATWRTRRATRASSPT